MHLGDKEEKVRAKAWSKINELHTKERERLQARKRRVANKASLKKEQEWVDEQTQISPEGL